MSFGENLLSLRKAKGMSQDELGAQLNVSRQTVSKWELDETTPELGKLILLGEYFGVSIDDLVKGQKPAPKAESDTFEIEVTKTRNTTCDIILLVLKIAGIILGGMVLIDVIVMIIYFITNRFPSL